MSGIFGGGSSKQKVTNVTQLPASVTRAMDFVTNFGQQLLGQGPAQSFGNYLTSGIRPLPGQTGSEAPPSLGAFTPPTGNIEQFMQQLFMGGPNNFGIQPNSFMNELARGEAPGNTMAQFRNELDRSQAQVLETLGTTGQRFGSGLAEIMDRNAQEALTSFGATTEKNALQANALNTQSQMQALQQWLLTGGGLMGSEQSRNNNALAMLYQDFLRRSGMPLGLDAIISGAGLGRGAGTSTSVTKASGGGNPLGEIGQLGQAGMQALPFLSSLFSSGSGAAAASADVAAELDAALMAAL